MNSRKLYLDLMKLSLTDLIYENNPNLRKKRIKGKDWPNRAYTMIGIKRLNNLQRAVEDVLQSNVPGDLVEAGVWRGGATIFMRALLKAYDDTSRIVWVADSFKGLPTPDSDKYPKDRKHTLYKHDILAASVHTVKRNFRRFELYDNQVRFLKGWFKDTLPSAPIEKIAVLRLDGDYYESTMDTLINLYGRVSPGGWVIVDDYVNVASCREAVHDFRKEYRVTAPIKNIDWSGVYWIKT
jgi:hypothetical protein